MVKSKCLKSDKECEHPEGCRTAMKCKLCKQAEEIESLRGRVRELEVVLGFCEEKLGIYARYSSGAFKGGIPHAKLMNQIKALLEGE